MDRRKFLFSKPVATAIRGPLWAEYGAAIVSVVDGFGHQKKLPLPFISGIRHRIVSMRFFRRLESLSNPCSFLTYWVLTGVYP